MTSEFAKEKVFWTKAMNLSLAKFMEDKPHIWDPKHPKYLHVGSRDETFAQYAALYNDEFSWQAVKERWTNIRSTYGFYMRKVQARKAKGEDFKVNWFMWKPCKYLYKVHKFANAPKSKSGSTNDTSEIEQQYSDSEDTTQANDDNYPCHDTDTGSVSCEEVVENIATVFKGVQNETFTLDRSKYAVVGHAVTKKLSQLNSYDAARLSQKILEILAEYDENNPMNPNKAF